MFLFFLAKIPTVTGAGCCLSHWAVGIRIMHQDEHQAAVAAFIRSRGVTRCPTACALPTQGTVAAADQAALQNYVAARSQSRQQKISARERAWRAVKIPAAPGE
jgi:hypothetical protein